MITDISIFRKTITVFGSAAPKPGAPQYEEAYKLGRLLGDSGFNVCTGGNRGIMEAVSKGAAETGVEAVGITIKKYSNPNPYLTKHLNCKTLFERIENLINYGDAYIVMRGGTGTMLELAAIWEFMNKGMLPHKPAACLSDMWKQVTGLMNSQLETEGRITGLLKHFETVEECAEYIKERLEKS